MNTQMMALVVGGVLPAVLFGVTALLQKSSTQAGIDVGPYLLCIGVSVAVVGALCSFVLPGRAVSLKSGLYASLVGVSWALGMSLIAIALTRYAAPLSKLVPIYNMNTLVAVLLALVIFAEWRNVSALKLAAGALLIVVGGTLVARS